MYIPRVDEDGSEVMANGLPSKTNTSQVLFLKCNGALCYGSSLEEAFHYMLHLEAASKIQVRVNTVTHISDFP